MPKRGSRHSATEGNCQSTISKGPEKDDSHSPGKGEEDAECCLEIEGKRSGSSSKRCDGQRPWRGGILTGQKKGGFAKIAEGLGLLIKRRGHIWHGTYKKRGAFWRGDRGLV